MTSVNFFDRNQKPLNEITSAKSVTRTEEINLGPNEHIASAKVSTFGHSTVSISFLVWNDDFPSELPKADNGSQKPKSKINKSDFIDFE